MEPLSEHEQRQLDQIEQSLYADYPKLAQAVRAKDPRVHYKRRLVQAAAGFVLGAGLLLAGVLTKFTLVGAGGFLVMLACAVWALTSWRRVAGPAARGRKAARAGARTRGPGAKLGRGPGMGRHPGVGRGPSVGRRPARPTGPGFMERLEDRWRRRQERGDF